MNEPNPLVVANLKANKTWDEMSVWLDEVGPISKEFSGTIVVCPSAPFLSACHLELVTYNSKIKLGAQDISRFEQGAYTGEVAASQIASICQYVIIGHSERRQNFKEDDETLAEKTSNAQKANLKVIYCVQAENDIIPNDVEIVAYEPTFAIGTGNPDTPENAKIVARNIKEKKNAIVLYGGSVSAENVKSYLAKDLIDGILVGATNSLDPQKFVSILKSASF